jgi:hypothetical protein
MAIIITIPNERAAGWNNTLRIHWTDRDELVQAIWYRMYNALPDKWQMFEQPVDIHVVGTFKGQMLDSDNICAKLYIDALKTRLLRDDNPRYVRRVTTESRKGKANSVTIQLIPVEAK